jgi:hypothetical protein
VSVMTLRDMASNAKAWQRATALGLVLMLLGGCGENGMSPSSENPTAGSAPGDSAATAPGDSMAPTDSTIVPTDSTFIDSSGVVTLTSSIPPGIVFGAYNMDVEQMTSVLNGTMQGGGLTADNILSRLAYAKSHGFRMVIKLCMGDDKYVKNADGTFSFTKWKALVDRFRSVNLGPYITDGTILGHFLIDEPHRAAKWGKPIPQSTVEAMAKYSKQIWPGMTTFVRVVPSWLAAAPITYTYLDAGWLQYAWGKGDVGTMVASEVAIAKSKHLGLMVGLNVLQGGNGSSGIPGTSSGNWAMSASEVRSYGTTLLNQSYACGFYNWSYTLSGPTYFARSDIKTVMAELSTKAKAHVKTSCKQ